MPYLNKVLLVLGASSDMGLALLERIHPQFDSIIAHYHASSPKLDELKQCVGRKIVLIQADFASEDDTDRFISEIIDAPTHIVNCSAPKLRNERFNKIAWSRYQINFDIQIRSIVKVLAAFIPKMAKNKYGKIVMLVSSCTSGRAPRFMTDYVTVKYAALGLVNALASEYAEKHICINAVSPSMTETKFLEDIPDLIIEKNRELAPMGRLATTYDTISAVEYLLSDESSYVTGQNIVINGGM